MCERHFERAQANAERERERKGIKRCMSVCVCVGVCSRCRLCSLAADVAVAVAVGSFENRCCVFLITFSRGFFDFGFASFDQFSL